MNLHFLPRIIFIICLSLFSSRTVLAEIYQWTDDQGHTHFGDRPPQQHKSTEISGQLESINISKELSSPEMMLKHEQIKDQERQGQFDAQQAKQGLDRSQSDACREAREMLRKLKGRVVFLDQQGREMKVSEAERKQRARKMETAVSKHCL